MTLDMKEYCTEEYQTRISAWREKVPASRPEATAAPASVTAAVRCRRRGRPRRRDLREGAVYVRARRACVCVRACARVRLREGGLEVGWVGGGGGAEGGGVEFAEGAASGSVRASVIGDSKRSVCVCARPPRLKCQSSPAHAIMS